MKLDKEVTSEVLAELVVQGMQEKKAHDIVLLDLRKINNSIADYFIICSGNSTTQVESIMDGVEEEVEKNTGEKPWHREGHQRAEWILVDYANVVVHIFLKDKRNFYALENCWGDAEITKFEDLD